MATQTYSTKSPRTNTMAAKEMLRRVAMVEVSGKFAKNAEMPLNMTDNISFRRLRPFNTTAFETPNITPALVNTPGGANLQLTEGADPTAYTVDYTDVTLTLINYGILFSFTSKVQLLHEDDVPGDMVDLTGDTLGEAMEVVRIGALIAASANVRLASKVAALANITNRISANDCRAAVRTLASRRATKVREMLSPSVNVKTEPVEAAFIALIHTDTIPDVRDLTGFVHISEYGQRKPICDEEVGSWEELRFIAMPIMNVTLNAGVAVASTGLMATGGNVDVYDTIVLGKEAFGHVMLRGRTAIKPTLLAATTVNHANPMGLRGFVGANVWYAARALNENWMVRIRHGVTDV